MKNYVNNIPYIDNSSSYQKKLYAFHWKGFNPLMNYDQRDSSSPPTNDDVVYVDFVEGSKIGRGCGIKERPKESAPGQLSPAATEASRPRWTEATWDVVTITGSDHLLLLKCCRTPNKSRACTSIITNVQANNTCLTSIYFMFNPFIFLRIFKRVITNEGVKQGVLSWKALHLMRIVNKQLMRAKDHRGGRKKRSFLLTDDGLEAKRRAFAFNEIVQPRKEGGRRPPLQV